MNDNNDIKFEYADRDGKPYHLLLISFKKQKL